MKTPRIVDAMGELDGELVSWAVAYRREPQSLLRKPLLRACACLAVAVLACALVFFRGGDHMTEPSVLPELTAYSLSPGTPEAVTTVLQKGAEVPISPFEIEPGVFGFVFSAPQSDSDAPASVTVLTNGAYSSPLQAIPGLPLAPGRTYYVFIPAETAPQPYTVFLSSPDPTGRVYEYTLSITQRGVTAYAQLINAAPRAAS